MNKISALVLMFLIFLLGMGNAVFSHQPRLVSGDYDRFIDIKNPEVSQAFYAELRGEPVYYRIISENSFRLYTGILVPDIEGIERDVSVQIMRESDRNGQEYRDNYDEGELLFFLNGMEHEWTYYYEE